MKSLSRDVVLTLIIKLSLLFILWFVCFKGVEKPSKNAQQWLLGGAVTSESRLSIDAYRTHDD